MKKTIVHLLSASLLGVALTVVAPLANAQSTVIYRQNFGNTGPAKLEINAATPNWRGLRAAEGGPVYAINSNTPPGIGLAAGSNSGVWMSAGVPGDLPNVNSTLSPSDSNGFIYVGASAGASVPTYHALLYQNHSSIDRSQWEVESISWYAAATQNDSSHRLAIRLGLGEEAVWYVSGVVNTAPGGMAVLDDFAGVAEQRSVLFASADWYLFDLNTLTVGSNVAQLGTGDITAFGIYAILSETAASGDRGNFAFDTFTVDAVLAIPEPRAAMALFALFAAGAAMVRCRRKRT